MKGICVRLVQFPTFVDAGDENGNSGGYLARLVCVPQNVAVNVPFHEDDRKRSCLSLDEQLSSIC